MAEICVSALHVDSVGTSTIASSELRRSLAVGDADDLTHCATPLHGEFCRMRVFTSSPTIAGTVRAASKARSPTQRPADRHRSAD